MKKHAIYYTIIAMIAVLLTTAIFAYSNDQTVEDQKTTVLKFKGESIPVSDDMAILTDDVKWAENGLRATSTLSDVEPLIDRETAIQIALLEASDRITSNARSINVTLTIFTDEQTPVLPESNQSLVGICAWIVTFQDVTMQRNGPAGSLDSSVKATLHIVIDAATGDVLESIAYS